MTQYAADARSDLARLIDAAGASDGTLAESIQAMGVESAARAFMREVLDRADLRGCPPVDVLFRLHSGAAAIEIVVNVASNGAEMLVAPTAGPADATVEQSLIEVMRSVFGPSARKVIISSRSEAGRFSPFAGSVECCPEHLLGDTDPNPDQES